MPGVQYTEWTPTTREKFLAKLRTGHTVSAAAKAAKVSRSAAYKHREADEVFAGAWDAAIEEGTEILEEEAIRRATRGVKREKGIYHNGLRIGTDVETRYSDTLLIFLLKGRKPDVYRENTTVKHEGQIGIDDGGLSDERRGELIAAILDAARARTPGSPADESAGVVPPAGSADAGLSE
jgi:hypothetical protein